MSWNRPRQNIHHHSNLKMVHGFPLEDIPEAPSGKMPGVILVKEGWDEMYFMREHPDWELDDYFKEAEVLFKVNRIIRP